jgi:2-polyprenyl-3-methyl-5-hydroxy-6-metoxy-1,4-benzoquinol methylase
MPSFPKAGTINRITPDGKPLLQQRPPTLTPSPRDGFTTPRFDGFPESDRRFTPARIRKYINIMDNASLQKESFEIRADAEILDQRHRMLVRECLRLRPEWADEPVRIIDYAANGSQVLPTLKQKLPDAVLMATDITEVTVRRLQALGIGAVRHDHEELLLTEERYHIAIAGEIIEHLISPENFFYSINHNLVDGGYAIVTIPNCTHLVSLAVQLVLDYPPMFGARYRSCHVRDYTYRLVRLILEAHGFRVVRRYGTEIPWCPDWTHILTRPFARLGRCIVIVARKMTPPNDAMIQHPDDINYLPHMVRFLKQQRDALWKTQPDVAP